MLARLEIHHEELFKIAGPISSEGNRNRIFELFIRLKTYNTFDSLMNQIDKELQSSTNLDYFSSISLGSDCDSQVPRQCAQAEYINALHQVMLKINQLNVQLNKENQALMEKAIGLQSQIERILMLINEYQQSFEMMLISYIASGMFGFTGLTPFLMMEPDIMPESGKIVFGMMLSIGGLTFCYAGNRFLKNIKKANELDTQLSQLCNDIQLLQKTVQTPLQAYNIWNEQPSMRQPTTEPISEFKCQL
jgi:hypothetical protein